MGRSNNLVVGEPLVRHWPTHVPGRFPQIALLTLACVGEMVQVSRVHGRSAYTLIYQLQPTRVQPPSFQSQVKGLLPTAEMGH